MDELKKLKEKYINDGVEFEKESRRFSNMRLLFVLLIIGVALANFRRILEFPYILIEALLIVAFFIAVNKEGNSDRKKQQAEGVVKIIEQYEKRENGQWNEFGETGESFADKYSYLMDLQIFGENSLYQFLNCCNTLGGKNKLAKKFKKVMEIDGDIVRNDAEASILAVTELSKNKELILKFQEKIASIKGMEKMDAGKEKNAFSMDRKFSKVDFAISLILSVLSIVLAVMSKFNIYCLLVLIPVVFIQFVSAVLYQNAFDKEISATGKNVKKLKELQEVCQLFDNIKFDSELLNQLACKLQASKDVFVKLKRIDCLESFRKNFLMWFFGNVFLSLNRFIVREYGKIENDDKLKLYDSLTAVEDIEVLISLVTINIVKKTISVPEFTDETKITVENIKHPMLVEEKCVSNSFNSGRTINIITGSNMSGKTSFMKTIGVNLVLAYSGAYVNCEKFIAPVMKIYTSINVKDDINQGISKFYAELLRLKDAILAADNGEKMVLFVDEIFSGTNYQDRMYGAKNIISKLSNDDVLGFITTHDFELCEIDDANIVNYHFSEEYIDGKMNFSHKIRDGKCNGTNAIQLMNEVGILH